MREEPGAVIDAGSGARRFASGGSDLDRKFWVALVLYAVLAVLVWFTMGDGKVSSWGSRWN